MFRKTSGFAPSFTLIELLIVIAILAVLAVAVVLILNPTELLKESRDTTRIQDLAVVNKALALVETDTPSASLGTSTFVYVSIPDSSATCSNLGLPALPAGYTYACAPTSTVTKTDGTGWIPVSFDSLSFGAPFSKLPADPTNTTSSGLYYTYIPGGSWKLTALFESEDRTDEANKDGGVDSITYEVGTSLTLAPFVRGLVGWWKMDDNAVTSTVTDYSENDFHGVYGLGTTSTAGFSTSGKIDQALNFVKTNASSSVRIVGSASNVLNITSPPLSLAGWVYPTSNDRGFIFVKSSNFNRQYAISHSDNGGGKPAFNLLSASYVSAEAPSAISLNAWHHIAGTWDGSTMRLYVDGNLVDSESQSGTLTNSGKDVMMGAYLLDGNYGKYDGLNGKLDDLRIYKRVLSATEIEGLYNAGQ